MKKISDARTGEELSPEVDKAVVLFEKTSHFLLASGLDFVLRGLAAHHPVHRVVRSIDAAEAEKFEAGLVTRLVDLDALGEEDINLFLLGVFGIANDPTVGTLMM